MTNKEVVLQVEKYLAPIMEENSLELVEVDFLKEVSNYYLRIFIDKVGGIFVEDCEKVSRAIEKILDEKDFIVPAYILEVSSPGIDRALKKDSEYEKYKGRIVDVKLYKAVNGQKQFQGTLVGLHDGVITFVDEQGCEFNFNRTDVAICRLAVIF